MAEIEHKPWIGDNYSSGINGERIAIVGHSHYLPSEMQDGTPIDDGPFITILTVKKFIGEVDDPEYTDPWFFKGVSDYFCVLRDKLSLNRFWHSVSFLNFIPSSVGGPSERYREGSDSQIFAARKRIVTFLETHKPDKLIVFTTKGWRRFPDTLEGENLPWLDADRWPNRHDWGTYQVGNKKTRVFALRHPQGAKTEEMREAVKIILAMKFGD